MCIFNVFAIHEFPYTSLYTNKSYILSKPLNNLPKQPNMAEHNIMKDDQNEHIIILHNYIPRIHKHKRRIYNM